MKQENARRGRWAVTSSASQEAKRQEGRLKASRPSLFWALFLALHFSANALRRETGHSALN